VCAKIAELQHGGDALAFGCASSVLGRFQVTAPALSLGGVETLACLPARTSHRELVAVQRAALGITAGLIRVSVGVEDIDDLINDFAQALDPGRQD
jgi:methionine-gamma-lyase